MLAQNDPRYAQALALHRRAGVAKWQAGSGTRKLDLTLFNPVYIPYLENKARTQIFYGGSSSGKSVFLAQRVVWDVKHEKRNYLVVRQVGRTLRGSVFSEVVRAIDRLDLRAEFSVNKSDMLITCKNGNQIIFAGLDDVEKLKSLVPARGAITDIWIEEATETERNTVKQLYKRQRGGDETTPKRMTFSFNPVLQSHWLYTDYLAPLGWAETQMEYNSPELSVLKTWYIHNQFLTAGDVADLENETDEYFRDVYTFGNWGVLGDVIFKNWTVEDLSGMHAQFTNPRHGLDFGFSSDPAAMPVTHYDVSRKTIYVYDELYERGLTNDMLAREVNAKLGRGRVICDSAEPKSIVELRAHGIEAFGAKKGKDSVLHGVQWLQQQKIIVDTRCVNMQNELRQYHWKKDKDGNATRQPSDKNNHLIDGLRYAYEEDSAYGGGLEILW